MGVIVKLENKGFSDMKDIKLKFAVVALVSLMSTSGDDVIKAQVQPDDDRTKAKVTPTPLTLPYENNFEKAEVGEAPEDFLVLDGEFTVKEEGRQAKFAGIARAPPAAG